MWIRFYRMSFKNYIDFATHIAAHCKFTILRNRNVKINVNASTGHSKKHKYNYKFNIIYNSRVPHLIYISFHQKFLSKSISEVSLFRNIHQTLLEHISANTTFW